jgi:hypothetical protein
VFHSGNTAPIDCHSMATGARCAGYPTYASPTAGDPLGTGAHTLATQAFESADVVGSRIYYPVGVNGTTSFGVACADVVAGTSCGYTQLGTGTLAFGLAINGGVVIGSRYYLLDRNTSIDCFDASTQAPCAGGRLQGLILARERRPSEPATTTSRLGTTATSLATSDDSGAVAT